MEEKTYRRPVDIEKVPKVPASQAGTLKFWLLNPTCSMTAKKIGDSQYLQKEKSFFTSVRYVSQAEAMRGWIALEAALKDAIFIATSHN